MDRDPIPDDVKRFILARIPSVPHLEALLLLRDKFAQAWSSTRVAERLYIPPGTASGLLADLYAGGLLEREGDDDPLYRYRPADERMYELIDRLADTYARNLIGVSTLIHSTIGKRARQFSDAFKLRGDS